MDIGSGLNLRGGVRCVGIDSDLPMTGVGTSSIRGRFVGRVSSSCAARMI